MDKTEFSILLDIVLVLAHHEKPEYYRAFECGVLSEEKIQQALKILTFIFSYDVDTRGFVYSTGYANGNLEYFTRCGSIDIYFETISNIWATMMREERHAVLDRSLRVMSTGFSLARLRETLMQILYLGRVIGVQALMNYLEITNDPVCQRKPRFSVSGKDYICYMLYEKEFYIRTFININPELNSIPTKPCIIFDASALEHFISIPRGLIPQTFVLNDNTPVLKAIMSSAYITKLPKLKDIDKHPIIVVSETKVKKRKTTENYRADIIESESGVALNSCSVSRRTNATVHACPRPLARLRSIQRLQREARAAQQAPRRTSRQARQDSS